MWTDYSYLLNIVASLSLAAVCRTFAGRVVRDMAWRWMLWYALAEAFDGLLDLLPKQTLASGLANTLHILASLVAYGCLAEFAHRSHQGRVRRFAGRWAYAPFAGLSLIGLARGLEGLDATLQCFLGFSATLAAAWSLNSLARRPQTGRGALRLATVAMMLSAICLLASARPVNLPFLSMVNRESCSAWLGVPIAGIRAGLLFILAACLYQYTRAHAERTSFRQFGIAPFFGGALALVLIAGGLIATESGRSREADLREDVLSIARMAATSIPYELTQRLSWSDDDLSNPAYQTIKKQLMLCRTVHPDYRFVCLMGYRQGKVYVLADSEPPDSTDYSPPGEPYPEAQQEIIHFHETGRPVVMEPLADHWGTWVSGYVPIPHSPPPPLSVALCIDIEAGNWRQQVALQRFYPLIVSLLVSCLVLTFFLMVHRRDERATQEIADSERRYRTLVENSPVCVVLLDDTGRCVTINPQGRRAFTTGPGRDSGMSFVDLWPACERDGIQSAFERALLGEQQTLEAGHLGSDGTSTSWSISLNPIRTESDGEHHVVAIATDITHHKLAEAALLRAKEAAEFADRVKTQFLANMSHEIRTPMTTILGHAENLTDPEMSEAERGDAVRIIRRSGDHLLGVINDVLDLSRIESGSMSVDCIPCSPHAIVAEVETLMRTRAEEKNLTHRAEFIGPIPETIRSDPVRLRQILANLVGNALKFTEAGGICLTVRLVPDASPTIQFDIVDTGIGMSVEQAGRVFEPFTQADEAMARRFGGTGLGLTLSRGLARMLGGDVSIVETQPGVGTRFRLTVATGSLEGTRTVEHALKVAADDTGTPHDVAPPASLVLRGTRILLADRDAEHRQLLSRLLRRDGAQVVVTDQSQAAVEATTNAWAVGNPFDVVLMDMEMPAMDGYQAARSLRERGYRGTIIALVSHPLIGNCDACIQAGCDDYTSKPVDRDDLVSLITGLVGHDRPPAEDPLAAQA